MLRKYYKDIKKELQIQKSIDNNAKKIDTYSSIILMTIY